MPRDFDLIVSTYAFREENAIVELTEYLGSVYVVRKQRSLILLKTPRIDPYYAVEKIRELIDPFNTNILRVIPVDEVTSCILQEVAEAIWRLVPVKIGEDETFRITIDGYLYKRMEDGTVRRARTRESIEYIAERIDRKVNLSKPDKVVYVKTVALRGGDYASITICKPTQIISTQRMQHEIEASR